MDNLKKTLNFEQQKAVEFDKGPLLIIAGAGTGKTTVITERIKYLINHKKTHPSEILALTFTEKAAAEMEQRVDEIMPYGYTQMWIDTFHSFCDQILKAEAINIGLDYNYRLLTEAETALLVKKNLFKFKLKYFRPAGNPTKFLSGLVNHFSRLKDEDISVKDYMKFAKNNSFDGEEKNKINELAQAYKLYEELKRKDSILDFGDLICLTLFLFRQRRQILKFYQNKFRYILVDEFQDTNISQNELVKLLAGKQANLTVVADDDQAIYRWRGAAISNVLDFKKTYPQAKIVTLTKNYRSGQIILNRAYDLIQHNNPDRLEVKESIDKKLVAIDSKKDSEIELTQLNKAEEEADWIVKKIIQLIKQGYQYRDIAILFRANNHADLVIRSLIYQGIPFTFLGPGQLLKQDEIKDLIAYLYLLDDLENNTAFFRIACMPNFKLTGYDLAILKNYSRKHLLSFFETAQAGEQLNLTLKSKENIKKLVSMIIKHLDLIKNQTAGQILFNFLEDSGLLKTLTNYQTEFQEQKANNIAKFFNRLKMYELENKDASVSSVVEWLNWKMEMGESPATYENDLTLQNRVNLLTVHSAKGLEFPVVFMISLVHDRFPTRERKESVPIPEQLIKEVLPEGNSHEQEERRLFYVGMTRAKEKLFLTAAKFYGEGKRMKKISPFVVDALGEQAIENMLKQAAGVKNQLSIFDFKPAPKSATHRIKKHQLNYVSYSLLQTFVTCPLQYKFRYILGISTPPNAASSFGSSIHNTLKLFYKEHSLGKRLTNTDLQKMLKHSWSRQGYSSKEQEQIMFTRASKFLQEYFKKGYQVDDKPIALEQTFIFKLTPQLKIGGRIDRIDELKNTIVEVIDYKTGRVYEKSAVNKDKQMSFYALAMTNPGIFAKDPEQIIFSFYFLETQEKISTHRTEKDLKEIKQWILEKTKEIEESNFLPKPGKHCDFCPYRLLCPAWK